MFNGDVGEFPFVLIGMVLFNTLSVEHFVEIKGPIWAANTKARPLLILSLSLADGVV